MGKHKFQVRPMYEKFLIIGGSRGLGHDIAKHFQADNVSRSAGRDIRDPESRKKIAQKSLDYDVVINHAYCGDFSQMEMLKDLCFLWKAEGKSGYIIHTGSMSSYRFNDRKDEKWWLMAAAKASSDQFINYLSHASAWREDVKFRVTNIRPGMLGSEKDRQKPHFKAGISGKEYCRLIEYLLSVPENIIISEIILEARCHF